MDRPVRVVNTSVLINNDMYSTVYAANFINYTTCFGPNGPSSGVSFYTLSTFFSNGSTALSWALASYFSF
jgi:hypothetical protein